MVSTDVLIGLRETASEFGISADRIAREVGLDPTVLDNRGEFVDWNHAALLRERLAEAARCPHFGLLAIARQPLLVVGLLGPLARSAPNFGTALKLLVRYIFLVNEAIAWHITEDRDVVHLARQERGSVFTGMRQTCFMGVAGAANSLKGIAGPDWRPATVSFTYDRPRNVTPFREFFNAPVHFRQEYSGLAIRRVDLAIPLATRDDALCRLLTDHAESLLSERHPLDVVELTSGILRRQLGTRQSSLRSIAGKLNMHPKQLQRRLVERGHTFRELSNEVRYELARRHVEAGDVAMKDLALLVGLADTSALSRGFRNHFGMSPEAWRRRQKSKQQPATARSRSRRRS